MSLHFNINIPLSQPLMQYNGLNYFIHYFSHVAAKREYVWRIDTHTEHHIINRLIKMSNDSN